MPRTWNWCWLILQWLKFPVSLGETSITKRPYTFRNPSLQHRFIAPANTFDKYAMRQGVMKTPVLQHGRLPNVFSPYENAFICRDEGYASAMEIEDIDMWDNENAFDMETDFDGEEDNYMKRKNSFVYAEREYLPQKKAMNPRMYVNKENHLNSAKMGNETTKRQAVLCTDTPRGLGFKLEKKEKSLIEITQENSPKLVPKSASLDAPLKPKLKPEIKILTFPRIFTVTVEKLQTWKKTLSSGQMVFELYGILEKVLDVKFPNCKKLQLKSQNMKSSLMCNFYEIDRALPRVASGQWCRCIVLWRQNNEYQCVSIRSASANELKNLDKWVVASSKSMAVILKTLK